MNYLLQCVEFDRKPVSRQRLRGFVLATSEKLTLVQLLDDNFYLNGYSVIRNRDVRRYWVFDSPEYFLSRALRLKELTAGSDPGISLESWTDVLESANRLFPLVTIHQEKIKKSVFYIGRVASLGEKTFKLNEISPEAEWDRTTKYRFKDLTRVDFGGGYEDALARVAAEDEERRLKETEHQSERNTVMSDLISLTTDGDVGIITVNNPPVNALSPGVPEGIAAALEAINADDNIKAAILIGGGRTFIAGADIKEFGKITSGQNKQGIAFLPLLLSIEDCPKPMIAAIHGTAFGGGLEVAMAFHYRVAAPSAQVGQPEVKLGIIPGAAGTQRLPRLAGVAKAVEMCAFGDPIKAAEALEFGIIDRIIADDLLAGAVAFAREIIASGERPPKTRERSSKLGDEQTNAPVFEAARDKARKTKRGMMAPLSAISAVEAATKLPFDQGCEREAELFRETLFSDQSKAMIHVFFGEREVTRIPDIPKETATRDIRKAAVVGAGTMGGGIAMVYANAGIPVLLKETGQDFLDRGLATIKKNYANSVKRGRFSQEVMDKRMALIQPTLTYDGFEDVDIVVEAVFEGMELKKQIFGDLDRLCKPDAILASNTSTLNIDEIASATSRPRSVIGHHFFSPANVMRLLEIVRGKESSKEVVASSMALARKLNKVGVLVGNCRGFVGNRMLAPYGREAQFLVEEGARVEAVDGALYNFGMAMGVLAMGDLAGLDVGWRIRKEYQHLEKPGIRQPLVSDRLCEMGRYGQKTGAGWYRYDENRKALPDPEVEELIEQLATEAGIKRREISSDEIIERTMYALVNEGARILEEGYALRAVDIDIIYLYGYAYPAWRGGPMWYADTVGLRKVYDRVSEFHAQHGELWEPAPLLKELAEQGKTFADYDKQKGK